MEQSIRCTSRVVLFFLNFNNIIAKKIFRMGETARVELFNNACAFTGITNIRSTYSSRMTKYILQSRVLYTLRYYTHSISIISNSWRHSSSRWPKYRKAFIVVAAFLLSRSVLERARKPNREFSRSWFGIRGGRIILCTTNSTSSSQLVHDSSYRVWSTLWFTLRLVAANVV